MKVLKINYPKSTYVEARSQYTIISNATNIMAEKTAPPRIAIYMDNAVSRSDGYGYSPKPSVINFKTIEEAEKALENIIHFFVKSGGNYMEIDSL